MERASLLIRCAWQMAEACKNEYDGLSLITYAILTVCAPRLVQMMVISQVRNSITSRTQSGRHTCVISPLARIMFQSHCYIKLHDVLSPQTTLN